MGNIDVYVKCYYPYAERNRRVSVTGCKMIWVYLLSDAHFKDMLQRKINAIEKSNQSSGQTLSDLYLDVFWDRQEERLSTNFDFYTKEGGRRIFDESFEISFDDINLQADTIKLGHNLKSFLLKEDERVYNQSTRLFCLLLFLLTAVAISLGIYGINSMSLGYFMLSAFVSASAMGTKVSLYECCISRCLPKETEYKTSFDLKKGVNDDKE